MADKTIPSFNVFLRTFLIQATWNFERMQNLGFCFSLLPALKRIHVDREALREAIKRHLEFFNTHPYMAAPVIGAALWMEKEVAAGRMTGEDVKTVKTGVMGSYGAIGDSFFWGSVKPFSALAGVFAALFGTFIAPVLFLALYNMPHIAMRTFGFYGGCRLGPDIFDELRRINFIAATKRLRYATVLLGGAFLAFFLEWTILAAGMRGAFDGFMLAALVLGIGIAMRKGLSPQKVVYLFLVFSIGVSALK